MNLSLTLMPSPSATSATMKGLTQLLSALIRMNPKITKAHHASLDKLVTSLASTPDMPLTFGTFLPICDLLVNARHKLHEKGPERILVSLLGVVVAPIESAVVGDDGLRAPRGFSRATTYSIWDPDRYPSHEPSRYRATFDSSGCSASREPSRYRATFDSSRMQGLPRALPIQGHLRLLRMQGLPRALPIQGHLRLLRMRGLPRALLIQGHPRLLVRTSRLEGNPLP